MQATLKRSDRVDFINKHTAMKPLFSFLLAMCLFSCKQASNKQDSVAPDPQPYITPAGDKIIFLGDYYLDYLNAIKNNYKKNDSLYKLKVHDAIIYKYFSKSEYLRLIEEDFPISRHDTTGIDTVGFRSIVLELEISKEKIKNLIINTLIECRKYLKNDSITVFVKPGNNAMKEYLKVWGGFSAVTPGSKQIMLIIADTGFSIGYFEFVISHEYNHTYWTNMKYSKEATAFTLLDYLVFEGKADSYGHFLYPNVIEPGVMTLSDNKKAELWNRIKSKLDTTHLDFEKQVMFGSYYDSVNYPICGGYAIGYDMVQSAMKNNPKLTPAELSALSPEKVLEMSDYKTK